MNLTIITMLQLTINFKDITGLVAMPHKAHLIAVLTTDKGAVLDIKTKKHLRTVPKWGGSITQDGKYGLYAPSRYVCTYHITEILELSSILAIQSVHHLFK